MLPCPSQGPQRESRARLSPQQLWGEVWPEGRAFCRWAALTPILCRGEGEGSLDPTDEWEQASWHLLGLCHRRPSGSSDSYHPKGSRPTWCQGTLVWSSRSCIYQQQPEPRPPSVNRSWGEASVQFSHSVVSNSSWLHEPQHARRPCPSPTPGVYSDSCPSSWWCHSAISSSVVPFSSCLQSFPASEGKATWQ